jgi:hypothetical protein
MGGKIGGRKERKRKRMMEVEVLMNEWKCRWEGEVEMDG